MASPLTRIAQYIVQRLGPTPQTGINKDDPQATLHVGGNIIADGAIGADTITATTLAADTIVGQTIQATVAFQGGSDTWLGYATETLSGVLSAVAQNIAGLKTFWGGVSSVDYVGTNPEVGGSSPFQLTVAHKRRQVLNPAGAITVKMPTTSVKAGETWTIVNRSTSLVTIQSSSAAQIEVLYRGFIELTALQDTPTLSTHWSVMDISDQGSFTPQIRASGTNFTGVTYSTQEGYFCRRRDLVSVSFLVRWTNTTGVPTGTLQLFLPFTTETSGSYHFGISVENRNIVYPTTTTMISVELGSNFQWHSVVGSGTGIVATGVVALANSGATDRYLLGTGQYAIDFTP